MSQTSIEIRPVSVTAVGISLGSLCGSLTFVIGAMWSVFAISWAIYDLANASKAAEFALYASMAVAAPIAGYLALRMSERIKTQGLYTAWFATFTFGIIAISTFARSSIFLFSLVAVYLMTAAAAVSAACFLRLALTNLNPYFYWPDHDVGQGATRWGPDIGRVLAAATVAMGVNPPDHAFSTPPQEYRPARRNRKRAPPTLDLVRWAYWLFVDLSDSFLRICAL